MTEYGDVLGLCHMLSWHPLAIKLAAAQIKKDVKPLDVYTKLKRDGLHSLKSYGLRDIDPRHNSLEEVVKRIDHRLTPAAQVLFYRLSLFGGNGYIYFDAIHGICNAKRDIADNKEELQRLLCELIRFNLLKQLPASEPTEDYFMLYVLFLFAWPLLEKSEEYEELKRQFTAYYLTYVEEIINLYYIERINLQRLILEKKNIQKAKHFYNEIGNTESLKRISDCMRVIDAYFDPNLFDE